MNKNLPSAITTIRELLGGTGDVALTIAHALDRQGLLVDPERTYGTVLRRTPQGWAPVVSATQPAPAVAPTALEQQAADWDAACDRARQLAAVMAATYAAEPDVAGVRADRDTVVISLYVTDLSRWAGWMSTLGITEHQLTGLEYLVCGRTSWDGVPLSVLAYDVPELQLAERARARRPYRHAGVLYDLAFPHEDTSGDRWYFQGETAEGMPLLSMNGRPERCTLASVVDLVGPLLPIRDQARKPAADTVVSLVEAGERA
ncbi:BN159_2729 family protein [Streptomyces sp. NPDC094048]|uniref:BN159_2729 family protein n=1 Tax=unclassified Streptomyces TaxID=2593676 RepID=UPI00331D386E